MYPREWVFKEIQPGVRAFEGEVLKGTEIPYGRGIMINEKRIHEGWFNNFLPQG
jgi:hypothetical protein